MYALEIFPLVCLVVSYEAGNAENINVPNLVGKLSWSTRIVERYLEFQDIGLKECARECMRRKRCQSFNYCKVLNYCELSYVKRSEGTPYSNPKEMINFVHSDVTTWSRTWMGKCEINNCEINSTCDIISGDCKISDCGPAVNINNTVELVYGDHVVGNGIIYKCAKNHLMVDNDGRFIQKGFEILKCKENGEWDVPNFKCIDMNTNGVKYGNHYFLFVDKRVTWHEAVNLCHNTSGILAELREKNMSTAVESEAKSRGNLYWLGGFNNDKNGWIWQSTKDNITFNNFPENYYWNGLTGYLITFRGRWYIVYNGQTKYPMYICQLLLSN